MNKHFVLAVLFFVVISGIFRPPFPAHDSLSQPAPHSEPQSAREIAITVDDLPLGGPELGLSNLQQMTEKLTKSIQSHHVPAVGLINESKLYKPGEIDARTALLQMWLDRGAELGNHTFSHPSFRNTPLQEFEDDVIRGETVTRMLLKSRGMKLRYFRFPFLQTGRTLEIKRQFEEFLRQQRYTNAPVTIENSDWMFASIYTREKFSGNQDALERVAAAYLRYTERQLDFFEKFSLEVLGYEPRQVLLLHANWLNADHFDDLVSILAKRGYSIITLEQALEDKAYTLPDTYAGPMGISWLERWAFAKGMKMRVAAEPDPPQFILELYKTYNPGK